MILSYYIPLLGLVKIKLKGIPEEFYYFLENRGEIKRLKRLEHLGVLQDVFTGMHHTRWDYTITMLYLTQQFSESKVEGLSTEKKINDLKLSGRDMIQLLVLTTNIGHLPGTFAVEKGVMRYLIDHTYEARKLYKKIGLLNDDINRIDYSNLNKLLLLMKLALWSSTSNKNEEKKILNSLKTLWYEMIFLDTRRNHREKIYTYFNFIRRVSYQLLDCMYVNIPLKIDYSSFIEQLPKYLLERKQLNTIAELTDNYSRIIYREIYHSSKACNSVVNWADAVHKFLARQNNPLKIIEKWLGSDKINDIIETPLFETKEIYSCNLPFRFGVNFLIDSFVDYQIEKLELSVTKLLKKEKALILYIPGLKDPLFETSTVGDMVFKVYTNKSKSIEDVIRMFGILSIWIYRKFKNHHGAGLLVKAAIEQMLQYLFSFYDLNLDVVIELPPDEFFNDNYIFINEDRIKIFSVGQKKEVLNDLKRKEDPRWTIEVKKQFAECKAVKDLAKRRMKKPIRGIGQYWIVIPGRIKFIDRTRKIDKCEFDGLLLSIITKKNKISKMILYLIEVKTGKRSSSYRAKDELKNKLKEIGIQCRVMKWMKRNAYAEINII